MSMRRRVKHILRESGLYHPLDDLRNAVVRPHYGRTLRREARFYRRFISRGGLVFDIGANKGFKTCVFRRLGARVVSVEPQAHCAAELRQRFADDAKVTVVQRAVGASEGQAEMLVSASSDISSLSPQWVAQVRASGRLADREWSERATVAVTTLDRLIRDHGEPAFCKIDVEGFEAEVLAGLSQSVAALSFEFTPEYVAAAVACVNQLARLGAYRFNWTRIEGDGPPFAREMWIDAAAMAQMLERLEPGSAMAGGGDVYACLHVPAE